MLFIFPLHLLNFNDSLKDENAFESFSTDSGEVQEKCAWLIVNRLFPYLCFVGLKKERYICYILYMYYYIHIIYYILYTYCIFIQHRPGRPSHTIRQQKGIQGIQIGKDFRHFKDTFLLSSN